MVSFSFGRSASAERALEKQLPMEGTSFNVSQGNENILMTTDI
jgi:hypothetical protein